MNSKVSTDKLLKNWNPLARSSNADLLDNLQGLFSRSRDLEKSNGIAVSIIDTIVDKTIGNGLKLTPQVDFKALGWNPEQAKDWNEKVENLWALFANSKLFDVAQKSNFNAMARLALRTTLMNGEVLALPYWNKSPGAMFNTQLKLVECDRLVTPKSQENNSKVHAGIKVDNNGVPVNYYIAKNYPDDDTFQNELQIQEIKAQTDFGRKQVIHIFKQDRVDQARGKPVFSPVLAQFKKLDMYEEAELSAAVVSALIALIIESPQMDDDELIKFFGIEATPERLPDLRTAWDRGLQDGSVLQLFPGEKAQGFTPNRPNTAFSAFIETNLKQICVAQGLPYEMVMKDFSKCNYSSARAAMQEGWEKILSTREWFVQEFVKEIYSLFLEEIANKNMIKAPDFYLYKEAYLKFSVHGPTRGILDPVKEANAASIRMTQGISSLQDECSAMGKDWEDVLLQKAKEEKLAKELGLVLGNDVQNKVDDDRNDEDDNKKEKDDDDEKI